MDKGQVAELVVTLRELRQAVRELRKDLWRSNARIRRLEVLAALAVGALGTWLGPGLFRLVS